MVKAIRVRLDRWETCKEAASSIRMKVFVKEQGIPVEIEMDDTDADCLHAVAVDLAGRFIGTHFRETLDGEGESHCRDICQHPD